MLVGCCQEPDAWSSWPPAGLVILASCRPAEPPVPANDLAVTRPCLPIRLPRLLYLPMCF